MPRAERVARIQALEAACGSRVLCYVTADRLPIQGQVSDDALRPLMSLLRQIGHVPRIDLFLYTRGGATDVPWRIVRQLRQHVTEAWRVLVPFRANSAGTLIALGADEIVLCSEGELGPIDPTMQIERMGQAGTRVQDNISVEDVMAYVRFLKERGGLTSEAAVSALLAKLVERVDPVALGNVHRTHSHIRDVARTILSSRKNPPSAKKQRQIISALAEKVYAHGHAIGFTAASEIGLPVSQASPDVDAAIWALLEAYEADLKLREPLDPMHALGANDAYTEDAIIAAVESTDTAYEFSGKIDVRAKRDMPQQLNVALNLSLQLPPGFNAQAMPPDVQALLQQMIQQAQQAALQAAQAALQQAMNAQARLTAAEVGFRGAAWRKTA